MPRKKTVLQQLSDAVDANLLAIMAGRPLRDAAGNPVLDVEGQPVLEMPSAADLRAAIARLKDCGITKMVQPDDVVDQLTKAVRRKIAREGHAKDTIPFPASPLDDEANDPATDAKAL